MEHQCGFEDREKMVREKLEAEDRKEEMATKDARELTKEKLRALGYSDSEIIIAPKAVVSSKNKDYTVTIDYIVELDGVPVMALICSMAVDSRERHITSYCRATRALPIPFGIVTDGLKAHVITISDGKVISNEMDGIPDRAQAAAFMASYRPEPLADDRREKEIRILLAFETTLCPKVQPAGDA